MDRFALEHNLRDASARIMACQEALLRQRYQVRELERCGLDASVARALMLCGRSGFSPALVQLQAYGAALNGAPTGCPST